MLDASYFPSVIMCIVSAFLSLLKNEYFLKIASILLHILSS